LVLRAIGEPVNSFWSGTPSGWMAMVLAILKWLGGMAFVLNTWICVKEK
jgi:hypothetical protein